MFVFPQNYQKIMQYLKLHTESFVSFSVSHASCKITYALLKIVYTQLTYTCNIIFSVSCKKLACYPLILVYLPLSICRQI